MEHSISSRFRLYKQRVIDAITQLFICFLPVFIPHIIRQNNTHGFYTKKDFFTVLTVVNASYNPYRIEIFFASCTIALPSEYIGVLMSPYVFT